MMRLMKVEWIYRTDTIFPCSGIRWDVMRFVPAVLLRRHGKDGKLKGDTVGAQHRVYRVKIRRMDCGSGRRHRDDAQESHGMNGIS
jgi:hypothetical protein